MTTRTSIELTEQVSRVVEVLVSTRRAADTSLENVRVRTFASDLPGTGDPAALARELSRLRRQSSLARDAVVTVWGLGAFHRALRLAAGPDDDLEARARAEVAEDLALLEAQAGAALVAVSVGREVRGEGIAERDVSLVAVPASALEERLAPILEAGFRVRQVVTPSLALAALAHRHREASGAVAYVALTAGATCIAVIRDGSLLLARELDWGHGEDARPGGIVARLGAEMRRSMLYFRQAFRAPVTAVVLCGDMPSLRSLTAPLGLALDVPIQTLDSLTGIDGDHVPEPADAFRAQVAALRLVIAAGAEPEPFTSLLHAPKALVSRQVVIGAAVGALVASLVTIAVWRPWAAARPSPPPEARTASEVTAPPMPAAETPLTMVPPPPQNGISALEVSSILTSKDRRLAIINGRVVGIGDRVGTDTVFDIRPRAVIMESPDGRRWTVQLQSP